MSDTIANLQLTAAQKNRNKSIQKQGFNCPDLIIFEPVGEYKGLFIELKKETPFKKDGSLKKQMVKIYKGAGNHKVLVKEYNHLAEQQKTIIELNARGYYATFSWGFDMTVQIITDYFNQNL